MNHSEGFTDGIEEYHNLGIYDEIFEEATPEYSPVGLKELSGTYEGAIDSLYRIVISGIIPEEEAKELDGYSVKRGDSSATFYRGRIIYDCFSDKSAERDIIFCLSGTVSEQISGRPPYSEGDTVELITEKGSGDITRIYRPESFSYDIVESGGLEYALARGDESQTAESGLENYLLSKDFTRETTATSNPARYRAAYKPYQLSQALKEYFSGMKLINPMLPGVYALSENIMPPAFENGAGSGGDENAEFYAATDQRLGYIDMSLIKDLDEVTEWLEKYSSSGGEYTAIDEFANLYSYIKYFGIERSEIEKYSELADKATGEGFTDEEIELLYSGTPEEIAERFASGTAIRKGKNLYSLWWIYLHSAQDYEAAGITKEDIKSIKPYYDGIGLTDSARSALEYKLDQYAKGNITALSNPGYSDKAFETAIDGLDYVYEPVSEPIYPENPDIKINPVSAGAGSYNELMSGIEKSGTENIRLLEYEIVSALDKDEALKIAPDCEEIAEEKAVLYLARALYDYIGDRRVDYTFYILQYGGHNFPAEGEPEYESGKRLFSPVVFESGEYAEAIRELRFALAEVNGIKLSYHIGSRDIKLFPTENDIIDYGYPECRNIDLEFSDGEESSITTEENNPEIYTQKSTLKSLADFMLSDWRRRGIISETSETRLGGGIYELSRKEDPIYKDVNISEPVPATGGVSSWTELLEDKLSEKTEIYLVTVEKTYDKYEANAVCGYDISPDSTLYRVKAYYDVLKDESTDISFTIIHAGTSERQIKGCPGFRAGESYLICIKDGITEGKPSVPEPLLEFELYEINGEIFAYRILGERVKLSGDYINLDMKMSESEREVVTVTENNPVIYTQKSTLKSLSAFLRDSFSEAGYISPSASEIRLLHPELGETAMGYEGYIAPDISSILTANPWTEDMKIEALPVYENPITLENGYIPYDQDYDKMLDILLKTAKRAGEYAEGSEPKIEKYPDEEDIKRATEKFSENGEEVPEGYFTVRSLGISGERMNIKTDIYLTATIEFKEHIALPDGLGTSAPESARKLAEYLKNEYSDILGMENPVAEIEGGDMSADGKTLGYRAVLYEGSGSDSDRILNYAFRRAEFYTDDSDRLYLIRIYNTDTDGSLGDFELITPEEAEKELEAGRYLSSAPYAFPGADKIARFDLEYFVSESVETFMPFYKFYVELPKQNINGLKEFGAYYVPAVGAEYIDPEISYDGSAVSYEESEQKRPEENPIAGLDGVCSLEEAELIAQGFGMPSYNLSLGVKVPSFKRTAPESADTDALEKELIKIADGLGLGKLYPEKIIKTDGGIESETDEAKLSASITEFGYEYRVEFYEPFDMPVSDGNASSGEEVQDPEKAANGALSGIYSLDISPTDRAARAGKAIIGYYKKLFGEGFDSFMSAFGYKPRGDGTLITVYPAFGATETYYRFFYGKTAVFDLSSEGKISRIVFRDPTEFYSVSEEKTAFGWDGARKLYESGEYITNAPVSEPYPDRLLESCTEIVYLSDGNMYFRLYADLSGISGLPSGTVGIYYARGY